MEAGAEAGAEAAADDGINFFSDEDAWDVARRHPERQRRGADPARAPLGRAAPRCSYACRRLPDLRRVHQPARPGRDRPARVRGRRHAHGRQARSRARELTTQRHRLEEHECSELVESPGGPPAASHAVARTRRSTPRPCAPDPRAADGPRLDAPRASGPGDGRDVRRRCCSERQKSLFHVRQPFRERSPDNEPDRR